MRFCQIDQITLLEPGKRIQATRYLSGKEDYLRDHFPRFAVMPGVMMLESLFQASALLVRATDEYRHGVVLMRAAKNVKFADFVQPGQTLTITSEIFKQNGDSYILKALGTKGDSVAVNARLVVECIPDSDTSPVDQYSSRYMKQLTEQLQQAAMA
ncbi:3-hydroxyacyl-ACP dehydratase FabZ family protein [Aureliella helgolandensis]|uniref:3-hydroxyacyl-[acyl-carrier-protein] dehydratase FabZ n=1 Tax=Aureliella helgolandensis TaxID=2527968 RepID=A0A518G6E7_9BACT|nr:3-hydroxyacyl-ACP dehydratase FabZ family protein [Aureliella helgolandensis]QDV24155.1 3-hydroxyacyl-[acyl-carrier-protein] dehydratase FabZ [Aureliella helgolandensis]